MTPQQQLDCERKALRCAYRDATTWAEACAIAQILDDLGEPLPWEIVYAKELACAIGEMRRAW